MLTRVTEPSRADSSLYFDCVRPEQATNEREATDTNPIKIVAQDLINSVAFLADGEDVLSGGREMIIRQWRVEDGKQVDRGPRYAEDTIWDLAVTHDGKWIVCGMASGEVIVWDATSDEKVNGFKAHI